MAATQIEPRFVERPWGSFDLSPFYPPSDKRIGEVWFPAGPILIKFLFTTDKLSVQVHPGDEYARRHESSAGKTEMWHILRAEPGARLALGFSRPVNAGQVRQAALDKTIEELLGWCEPAAGDTYLTPAGTVHALGGGLVLCEIQQDSDVTYRLYDYDRGRPLHLDKGLQVTSFGTHPGKSAPILLPDGGALLARCPYFVTERYPVESDWVWPGGVMIVLEGRGSLSGENGQPAFQPGEVWNADEGIVVRPQGGAVFLRTYAPV